MLTVVFLKSSQDIAARAESQKNGFRIKRYIALPVGKIGSKIQQVFYLETLWWLKWLQTFFFALSG